MKQQTLAIIYWTDASIHGTEQLSRSGWASANLVNGISTGIVIKEDKQSITVGMDFFYRSGKDDLDEFRTAQTYPKSGISKIKRVKIDVPK